MRATMTSKKSAYIQKLYLIREKVVADKKNAATMFNETLEMIERELPQRSQRNLTAKEMEEIIMSS